MTSSTSLKTKIIEALPWSESEPERQGWRGVLFKVRTERGLACLKTLRGKIEGTSLRREAEMLQLANKVGVGPKFIEYDGEDEILLMELVDGKDFRDWLPQAEDEAIRKAIVEALQQARRLDLAGIDHGQLSWAPKHVLVGEKVTIVDFERAGTGRKVNNLSSLAGFFFTNPHGSYSQRVCKAFGVDTGKIERIKKLMRRYRETDFKEGYEELLKILK